MSSVVDLMQRCNVVLKDNDRLEELPDGTVVFYSDASHRYWNLTPEGRQTLYAVSSVLGVLDRPGLLHWVRTVTLEGRDFWDVRDEASTRGTSVHAAGEHLANTGEAPDLSSFPEDDRGYVSALAKAWLALRPTVIATEVIVASVRHGFAGRFDLLADIGGARCLVDFKTGKKIYPTEMFCQLAAYELASTEAGHPPTDKQLILRLGEDGTYEVAESFATAQQFLAVKAAFDARREIEAGFKAQLKLAV